MLSESKLKLQMITTKIKKKITLIRSTKGENKAACLKRTRKDSITNSGNKSKMYQIPPEKAKLENFWKGIHEDSKDQNKEADWI